MGRIGEIQVLREFARTSKYWVYRHLPDLYCMSFSWQNPRDNPVHAERPLRKLPGLSPIPATPEA